MRAVLWTALASLLLFLSTPLFPSDLQHSSDQSPVKTAAAAAEVNVPLPELVDITDSTGIKFNHLSSPEQKYIVESMSGGVALIDYDRDGWPDIFFTNAQSVEMALAGKKARSALYHNNRRDRNGGCRLSMLGHGCDRGRL